MALMPAWDSEAVGNVKGSRVQFEGPNKKAPGHQLELKQPEDCRSYIEARMSHDCLTEGENGSELSPKFHFGFPESGWRDHSQPVSMENRHSANEPKQPGRSEKSDCLGESTLRRHHVPEPLVPLYRLSWPSGALLLLEPRCR